MADKILQPLSMLCVNLDDAGRALVLLGSACTRAWAVMKLGFLFQGDDIAFSYAYSDLDCSLLSLLLSASRD